jgi:hypothetical protein
MGKPLANVLCGRLGDPFATLRPGHTVKVCHRCGCLVHFNKATGDQLKDYRLQVLCIECGVQVLPGPMVKAAVEAQPRDAHLWSVPREVNKWPTK